MYNSIKETVNKTIQLPKCETCEPNHFIFLCPVCDIPCCCKKFFFLHRKKKICFKNFQRELFNFIVYINKQPRNRVNNHILTEYQLIINSLFSEPAIPITKEFLKMRSLAKKIDSLDVYNEEDLLKELTEEEREHYYMFKKDLNLKPPKKVVPFWIQPPEEESCLLICEADGWPMPQIEFCQKYLLKNIPPLLEVTTVAPTYFTLTGLINVLAVYTILYRHYEGQHIYPFAMETTTQLINLSGAFIARKYYVTKMAAIYHACNRSKLTALIKLEYINVKEVIDDVRNILIGPKNDDDRLNILCALGQIHQMFKECYNDTPTRTLDKSERSLPFGPFRTSALIKPETLEKLTNGFKVIHFYYSYVLSYYSKKWANLKDEPKIYL